SGTPGADQYKVKGAIHWLSIEHALAAEIRLYDRLFTEPQPDAVEGGYLAALNPDSVRIVQGFVEPGLADIAPETRLQFERHGYFVPDRLSHRSGVPVFSRALTLKDSWARRWSTGRAPSRAEPPDAADVAQVATVPPFLHRARGLDARLLDPAGRAFLAHLPCDRLGRAARHRGGAAPVPPDDRRADRRVGGGSLRHAQAVPLRPGRGRGAGAGARRRGLAGPVGPGAAARGGGAHRRLQCAREPPAPDHHSRAGARPGAARQRARAECGGVQQRALRRPAARRADPGRDERGMVLPGQCGFIHRDDGLRLEAAAETEGADRPR